MQPQGVALGTAEREAKAAAAVARVLLDNSKLLKN